MRREKRTKMKKNERHTNSHNKEKENLEKNLQEDQQCEAKSDAADAECSKEEVTYLKSKLEEKSNQCDEYLNMLQRTAAEFDNYKKRTVKEKESLYYAHWNNDFEYLLQQIML
jgi:molecular chaperone GrpE